MATTAQVSKKKKNIDKLDFFQSLKVLCFKWHCLERQLKEWKKIFANLLIVARIQGEL